MGTYSIDPQQSQISFAINHLIIAEVEGRFSVVNGTMILTEPFSNSSVEVAIPVSSINTAVKERDEDLQSYKFFDAEKFPNITLANEESHSMPR